MTSFDDLVSATIGDTSSGSALLDEAVMLIRDYVILPFPEAYDVLALWATTTHAQAALDTAPRLRLGAPEKGCGKTRTLNCVRYMAHDPLATVNISNAALVHSISDASPPTLIMDEYDTYFGKDTKDKHEDLRGIINSGFERGQNYIRWDPMRREREMLPTFCMVAMAGIGRLPDTVEDRAINITLRKRARSEHVKSFRTSRDKKKFEELGLRLGSWVRARLDRVRELDLDLPVDDREADVWEPLFKIAELAGDDWSVRVHAACAKICEIRVGNDQLTESEELLRDVHLIFQREQVDKLATQTLISHLVGIAESSWRREETVNGFQMTRSLVTDTQIATIMREYGVASTKVRVLIGGESKPLQGYKRDDLEPVWARNCRCGCRGVQRASQPAA